LKQNDNKWELIRNSMFEIDRQVYLECHLDSGNYILLPMTTGCNIQK